MQIKTTIRYHLTSVRKAIITKSIIQTINAGEGVEKWESSCTVGGNVYWYATMENSMEVSGEFVISLVLSLHSKFWSDGWTSVTAHSSVFFFFLVSKGKYILKAWGGPTQKRPTEELSSSILAPLFICFFPPPEPALYKLGGLFASPEVLTLVLRPCFVLFSWAFSFFVFQTLLFWTPFSYSNYLTLLYSIVSTQCSVMT